MSLIALFGALESGLIYALVAFGVLISFRILDFPDLTADGSFPLGGAVCAIGLVHHIDPWIATGLGMCAGALAGMLTAWFHTSLKIIQLLASILVMVALYSVNLRIMGAPNIPLLGEKTIFTSFITPENAYYLPSLMIAGLVILLKCALDGFFSTQIGLSIRATGANLRMAQAQGINTSKMIILGMAISNAMIALGGALFVQTQGGADISIGIGTIVIGLASVIIGETLIHSKRIIWLTFSVIIGAILYKLLIQLALSNTLLRSIGFGPQDLNLITAALVVIALLLPQIKSRLFHHKGRLS